MSEENSSTTAPFLFSIANNATKKLEEYCTTLENEGILDKYILEKILHTTQALEEGSTIISLKWPNEAINALENFWERNESFENFLKQTHAERQENLEQATKERIQTIESNALKPLLTPRFMFSIRYIEPWRLVFSAEFTKSIAKIDKKLQGRILEALTKIIESPITIIGDTMKPLTADLNGFWRYRIGDYRLIYAPNLTDKHITLLAFDSRGSVY